MSRVFWSNRARADLIEIGLYLAHDDLTAGRRFVDKLRARAPAVSRVPFAGRRVPEFDRDDLREVVFRGYRIVYLVVGRAIHVLTVLEGHRLLNLSDDEE